jgi:hypothetical protein
VRGLTLAVSMETPVPRALAMSELSLMEILATLPDCRKPKGVRHPSRPSSPSPPWTASPATKAPKPSPSSDATTRPPWPTPWASSWCGVTGNREPSHWVRDETLGEDRCRVRKGGAAQVLAAVRNVAVYLLGKFPKLSKAGATRRVAAHPEQALPLLAS